MYNTDTPIAFLGMGLMGSRMTTRLLAANFEVAVWNRTQTACTPLLAQGAIPFEFENASQYPVLLLCLADDHAVSKVFEQLKPYLTHGQIIIDFSSLSVQRTLALSTEAEQLGVVWIDSPVSGGTVGAEDGTLVIFAGGDAVKIEQLNPIYDVLSQRVTCMGATGTGQATKICNQLIVAANSTLIAEAVALAEKSGVDTRLLAPALAGGFADSKPFQILTPRMASQVFEPVQWKVQTLAKDLGNALSLAQSFHLHIPVAEQALSQLKNHQHVGYAEADLATLILSTQQPTQD